MASGTCVDHFDNFILNTLFKLGDFLAEMSGVLLKEKLTETICPAVHNSYDWMSIMTSGLNKWICQCTTKSYLKNTVWEINSIQQELLLGFALEKAS